jgi:L-iditol 2-dehydrogenase
VHYYAHGRIGTQVVKYPFAVGHEFGAIVAEVGRSVTSVKPGDRVAVDPAISCGDCDQCRVGRAHTCRRNRFLGCPGQAEGCMAEYIVMPAHCCYPIPAALSLEEAALIEPLSIGYYAGKLAGVGRGARVGILGCGPIGLSVMLPLLAAGVGPIYVTDKLDYRVQLARRAGAAWGGNPDRDDVVAEVARREPLLLDAVLECCGKQEAIDQALELLKPGGKLVFVGIPAEDRISFLMDTMRRREICVQNVRRQNACVRPALDLLAGGKTRADFMITHRVPLEQAGRALEMVDTYADGVVKAMLVL